MAPLTRSPQYKLTELPLEAPRVQGKITYAASYPIALANPDLTRLVTYQNKSGTCASCSKTAAQSCADCCGMVFYCNADCQSVHWPEHKDICHDLKEQHLNEVMEARDEKALNQITNDLGTIISSDFKSMIYRNDPKLSVKIDDYASFGDLYDVSEGTNGTIRSFHPGTYKCTSVTPDKGCTPIAIYHHVTVDPVKVMKQCILMSKDFFEVSDLPNQITMPDWCNWESADEEYIPSESDSESEADSEASESDLYFADFVGRVFDDKPVMASDSEDQEYDTFSESDSDDIDSSESEVSDHEVDYLICESKQYIKDLPQRRHALASVASMEVAEDETSEGSETEAYKDFKEVLASEHQHVSDISDSDYLPYSDSDSDSGHSIPERDISDSEKCISDNEIQSMMESVKDLRDLNEELYNEFVDSVFDSSYVLDSDPEEQDYIPADSDSASSEGDEISDEEKALLEEGNDLIKNVHGKRQSVQTQSYSSSSESDSDSEVSSEAELYEDFQIHTEFKCYLPDTEDLEYIPEQSDSETGSSSSSSEDEMEVSEAESDAIIDDSKDDVKQVSGQKRQCGPEDEDCQSSDTESEMESDELLYTNFRSKLIVSDPSEVDLGGSDDEEFLLPAESEESQEDSQDESQDEGSQASDSSEEQMDVSDAEIKDLEFSSEDELYEEFKDEVCKTQRKVQAQKMPKASVPSSNKELIYFMNSSYTSSLKDELASDKVDTLKEKVLRNGSFVLKNESESFGIAVEMKGRNWRSAQVFEDSTSSKCFALVIATDVWEHLSSNHEHLSAHYPDQKWSSIAETQLKFSMKDFIN